MVGGQTHALGSREVAGELHTTTTNQREGESLGDPRLNIVA